MEETEIKKTLHALQRELLYRDDLNADQISQLTQFRSDIDEFLERIGSGDYDTEIHPFRNRVVAMETKFAVKHPVLEKLFLETIEALAKMGV